MAGNVRIEINHDEIARRLKGDDVVAALESMAASIAAAAGASGGVFEHEVTLGTNRARAMIWTGDVAAMRAEARDRTLTRAIDAGRR